VGDGACNGGGRSAKVTAARLYPRFVCSFGVVLEGTEKQSGENRTSGIRGDEKEKREGTDGEKGPRRDSGYGAGCDPLSTRISYLVGRADTDARRCVAGESWKIGRPSAGCLKLSFF